MPILERNSLEYISHSAIHTRRVGMRLGAMLQPRDLICLVGDLGSGKTTLVQGLSAGWGSLDAVSSPTFVLVNMYRRQPDQEFFHLDAYRLNSLGEAEDLDLEMFSQRGPLVIEWADRIQPILPEENLRITMEYVDEDQRDILLVAHGARYLNILTKFRRQVYGVK
jgi:tRNA threonylcarbamoyladenosine biosynthesis protein TsaE